MKDQEAFQWDIEARYIQGVGPRVFEELKKRSIRTAKDLIHWLPRRFQDNRAVDNIASIRAGQSVLVYARVLEKRIIPLRRQRRNFYVIVIGDSTGRVGCKFFRLPYKQWFNNLREGDLVEVRGQASLYQGRLEFHHPQIFPQSEDSEGAAAALKASRPQGGPAEGASAACGASQASPAAAQAGGAKPQDMLTPIYTETEGLKQAKIRQIMRSLIQAAAKSSAALETLPLWLRKKYQLVDRWTALKGMHEIDLRLIDSYLEGQTPFHKRLIFDEFFELQLYLALKREGLKKSAAPPLPIDEKALRELKARLPFALTNAQERALGQIFEDMGQSAPMHRLIQGDVGCGKTLIALTAAFLTHKAGFQAALMAPTETLAEQHFESASRLLGPLGAEVRKLTGGMKAKEKREALQSLASGQASLAIGTHALIQEGAAFKKLALVVVDEQHRFGASQRAVLKEKAMAGGLCPHFLVMTATPIPRTLSLALYGDLNVSLIDEMPGGRPPVVTRKAFARGRQKVFDFLRSQIAMGRQGYVIYPLVEESEALDLKNANEQYEKLKSVYTDIRWGLLTGRMSGEEKRAVMSRFRQQKIQALVSTTVIEVGIDVPNATVIIIEHGERFGLSQLHQLRGRVGRGSEKSYCVIVLGERLSAIALERARIMERILDGFQIAEKDLELRGPGEILGERQHGLPVFKLADIHRDARALYQAREAARELARRDPQLKDPSHQALKANFEETLKAIRPG